MTEPLQPLPEAYVGVNNPYRGIEQHGVEAETSPTPVPGYGDTIAVPVEEPEPVQEPVPVVVVNQGARERRSWNTNRTFIDSTRGCIQIIGDDPRRTNVVLVNLGPETVYVRPEPFSNIEEGFPIAMDASMTLDSEQEIWGLVADTQTAAVRILWEYRQTLPNR